MRARAIDLFAGLGGFSEGAEAAGCEVVWAANHWPAAVDFHSRNHPRTQHLCQDLQQADWRDVPAHDIMLASPACQGHTNARGKEKPHHDALRSTAWAVVSAAECHQPEVIIIENVKEFRNWTLYPAWCAALQALGYSLATEILDAADHGVPQHRLRYIGVATKSAHPIELKLPKRPYVPISAVIDFNSGRWSPIDNGRRAAASLARIANGRAAFGERFIVPYYGSGSGQTGRSLDRPIGTLTTLARWAVIDGNKMRMLSIPEAKAAMGFRFDYQVPANIRTANFMLGNAVPPPMATDIIRAVLEAHA